MPRHRPLLACLAAATLALGASAQAPPFRTPGMPSAPAPSASDPTASTPQGSTDDASLTGRFASVFNPAFSFVVDGVLDHLDDDSSDDGFDAELRTLELTANSWV